MKLLYLLPFASLAHAFGAAGHEIVATIAQIYLFPSTLNNILPLLPASEHRGELAFVAAWADKIKFAYRWSSGMHYINGKDDYPPSSCYFGDHGWADEDVNIMTAISNYTQRMGDQSLPLSERSFALKFVVHLFGDLHQPLHLTGRNRGGNSDYVRFEGRKTSLHSLWDGQLIAKALRTLPNYTSPVDSSQIESALKGAIYDPYVRWLTYELLEQEKGWSSSEISSWLLCPHSLNFRTLKSRPPFSGGDREQFVLSPPNIRKIQDPYPNPPVCPLFWAEEVHRKVTCPLGFPAVDFMDKEEFEREGEKSYEDEGAIEGIMGPQEPLPVVSKEWYDEVRGELVLEKLLVMAGLRLAGTLNAVFGDELWDALQ